MVEEIIGASSFTIELLKKIDEAAQDDRTVLITGPTGTGKELIANNIHYKSKRKNNIYSKINITSVPSDLFESEFFGTIGGAGTGVAKRSGYVESTEGGTILIDEIGDLALSHQPKLLRFLDDKTYRKVGESNERQADVRIIASTNRNLEEAINKGTFRRDLYSRLNQYHIKTIGLDERPEDLIVLTNHFLSGKKIKKLPEFKFLLYSLEYPGNVRDLKNYCENSYEYLLEVVKSKIDNQSIPPISPKPQHKPGEDSEQFKRDYKQWEKSKREIEKMRRVKKHLKSILEFLSGNNSEDFDDDEEIDFEKTIDCYEIKTLYRRTNLSKAAIARELSIRVGKLSPKSFEKEFDDELGERGDKVSRGPIYHIVDK